MLGRRSQKPGLHPSTAKPLPRSDSGVMTRESREREDALQHASTTPTVRMPKAEVPTLPPPPPVDPREEVADDGRPPKTVPRHAPSGSRIRAAQQGVTTETMVADLRRDPRSEK